MPTSKHRRKGKARPRGKIAEFQPPTPPPPSPEELAEMAKEEERDRETEKPVCARLREIHGTDREWTDTEYDEARGQLEGEGIISPV